MKKFSLVFYLTLLGCNIIPSPSPPPDPSPTINPSPDPTISPNPSPIPVSHCPMTLPDQAIVYIAAKPWGASFRLDASVKVKGSKEYCKALGHSLPSEDCHLEGYPNRLSCEFELIDIQLKRNGYSPERERLGPVWQFNSGPIENGKIACDDNQNAEASCDHFGTTQAIDDPQTPTTGNTLETLSGFEGEPKDLGLQRDNRNKPKAGFFMTGHGKGYFRACLPDYTNCSGWNYIDH